ncbi:MAG: HAD family hydrolase [Clostridiales bacterium]|nr:HAD family hydrolase [Clostridiales bacterium]
MAVTEETIMNDRCIYSHIIWDFNGTILDDVRLGMDCANMLLLRRNLKPMTGVDDYRERFHFPIKEYYRELGFDFEKESYDVLAREWVDLYEARSNEARLIPGVRELIRKFVLCGTKQIVLSATEEGMLIGQLSNLRIYQYFDEVIGQSDIRAGSKVQTALEWMKRVQPKNVLMIGDTDHDYEVAQKIGVQCLLVASGHQSYNKLVNECKDAVVVKNIFDAEKIIFSGIEKIF